MVDVSSIPAGGEENQDTAGVANRRNDESTSNVITAIAGGEKRKFPCFFGEEDSDSFNKRNAYNHPIFKDEEGVEHDISTELPPNLATPEFSDAWRHSKLVGTTITKSILHEKTST